MNAQCHFCGANVGDIGEETGEIVTAIFDLKSHICKRDWINRYKLSSWLTNLFQL